MSNIHLHWGVSHQARAIVSQLVANTKAALVFIDQQSDLLQALQSKERYTIEVQSPDTTELHTIAIASVLTNQDQQAISDYICGADVITIATPEVNLPDIAMLLADALQERQTKRGDGPLNLLLIGGIQSDVAGVYQLLHSRLEKDFPLKEVLQIAAGSVNPLTAQPSSAESVNLISTPLTDLYVEEQVFTETMPTFAHLKKVKSLHDYQVRDAQLYELALVAASYSHYHYRQSERIFDQRSKSVLQKVLDEALELFLVQHKESFTREELQQYCTNLGAYFANSLTIDLLLQEQTSILEDLSQAGILYRTIGSALEHSLPAHMVARIYRWALNYLVDQAKFSSASEIVTLAERIESLTLAQKIAAVTGQQEKDLAETVVNAIAHSAAPASFTVVTETGLITYPYDDERTLLENLTEQKEISISAPCGGVGLCGKCRVRINSGQANPISEQEQRLLRTSDAKEQIRLACQTYFYGDQPIEVAVVQELTKTRVLADYEVVPLSDEQELTRVSCAFDIGTTTIALYLLDAQTHQVVQSSTAVNRQGNYGADVISRINYCQESPTGLAVLHETIVNQMDEMMSALLGSYQLDGQSLEQVAVVGNPTMIHLLLQLDPTSLAQAPFTLVAEEPTTFIGNEQGFSFASEAQFLISGAVSAYVGSDVTSGLAAVKLTASPEAKLYVDVGTNGEIALWDGKQLYSCASAAGPAFEGANISYGMSATDGAIERIFTDEQGALQCNIIGNKGAVGLCGSGIIDAVAVLLEHKVVDSTGAMEEDHPWVSRKAEQLEVLLEDEVAFTAVDVRQVQLAKAAIAAGIATLLAAADVSVEQLSAIYLAGGFGTALPLDSALRIGLLPPVAPHKVRAVGNAAGKGAVLSLTQASFLTEVERLRQECHYIELSSSATFMDFYIEEMLFPEVP